MLTLASAKCRLNEKSKRDGEMLVLRETFVMVSNYFETEIEPGPR